MLRWRAAVAALVAVVGLICAVAFASPAWAHAGLESSDPAANASLPASPVQVSATFNEPLQPTFAAMTVVGPDGNLWSDGQPRVDGATAVVTLRHPLGPAGVYTVNYRVTSADGHVVNGAWGFRLTTPETGTPGPSAAASAPADDGLPVWPFGVGAVVIVGIGAWWATRRRV